VVCDAGEIVVVPFPFTDGPGAKRRPALVLSPAGFNRRSGHAIMAMITSASTSSWPGDIPLKPGQLGLEKPCVIRMKFFTLDNRLIARAIGKLPDTERRRVRRFLHELLTS
jgi:mRNA interferase MazF